VLTGWHLFANPVPFYVKALSGIISGALASGICNPTDVVKVLHDYFYPWKALPSLPGAVLHTQSATSRRVFLNRFACKPTAWVVTRATHLDTKALFMHFEPFGGMRA
jgi:hypothetical protein